MHKVAVRAKHYNECRYTNRFDCAISRAIKAQFSTDDVLVGVSTVSLEGTAYRIVNDKEHGYQMSQFLEDCKKARAASYDEAVIREFKLIKLEV